MGALLLRGGPAGRSAHLLPAERLHWLRHSALLVALTKSCTWAGLLLVLQQCAAHAGLLWPALLTVHLPSLSPPQVKQYGVPNAKQFLAQHFPDGVALDSAYVSPAVVDQVGAHAA